ncbi:hypothetical protein [Paenibacillus barcinonensis]|nr:hypothetical protein [Paenibacillus barcinonensis]
MRNNRRMNERSNVQMIEMTGHMNEGNNGHINEATKHMNKLGRV